MDAPQRRVILAEDDHELRGLLAGALRDEGWDVREARDGMELLDRVEEVLADRALAPSTVIVSDVRMPGLSGLDVLAALRTIPWTSPVVLITAFGDIETHVEASGLGAAKVLDKPFDVEDLCATVRAVLPS